ncbi:hypothetical protein ABNF97_04240 [Plantactinospora sp. B6F1]|uniref:TolB family protein n=1 Tax=Plantactinospora sp. B6F1 TaxID=3158971 RepID=UPI0032D98BED
MSERADRLLREAVRELAGSPHQPPDLAATAMVAGRRMRRRRQAVAMAAAAVAIGAIAAPYVWLRPDPRPPALSVGGPPAATTPASPPTRMPPTPTPTASGDWRDGPVELPGGALLLTADSPRQPGPTWVYDSERRRYVSVPASYTSVRASARLPVAAVRRTDRPTEIGLYDLTTGKPQWFRTGSMVMAVEWSPDGRRLLATLRDEETGIYSIGLLTADGAAVEYYPLKTRPTGCLGLCRFTWLPNGREVALPLTERVFDSREGNRPRQSGIQLFAADDGMPTRFLPVEGAVASSAAWSPDGSLVVVSRSSMWEDGGGPAARAGGKPAAQGGGKPAAAGGGELAAQVVSTSTGKVVRQLPSADVTWVGTDLLLYLDTSRPGTLTAVLVDPAGVERKRVELPAELAASYEITIAAR